MTTSCSDVCDCIIDMLCPSCDKRAGCLDVEGNESEFHEQLIACIHEKLVASTYDVRVTRVVTLEDEVMEK